MEEVLYVLEGEVEYAAKGRARRATQGEWFVMPKGVSRAFRVRSGTARMVMLFLPEGFEKCLAGLPSGLTEDDCDYISRVTSEYGIPLARPQLSATA
jgi:hypothetical protein